MPSPAGLMTEAIEEEVRCENGVPSPRAGGLKRELIFPRRHSGTFLGKGGLGSVPLYTVSISSRRDGARACWASQYPAWRVVVTRYSHNKGV